MHAGETLEDLDGRFQTVRTRESNLGNFVCDVWRKAAGADIAILNGGSLRCVAHAPQVYCNGQGAPRVRRAAADVLRMPGRP